MREFPQPHFAIVHKLRQSASSSTFLVKPHHGPHSSEDDTLVLKLYTGPSARVTLQAFESDLCWQKGLVHPHLMGIASAGLSGKSSFYITRQFSQKTLDLISANPTHIQQVLSAVCFLHAHARAHGRIKPSNIFIVDGTVRLADLRLMNYDEYSVPESIRFAAPEILAGAVPTVESDYYSLGALLYRAFAKRDPFDDVRPEILKAKYLYVKIPSLRNIGGIRESLANAIDGLLHRNPRRRAAAFGDLLREFPIEPASVLRAPFVGRLDTMELLHSRVMAKTDTSLSVTLIEGDAGIGKSRLIEELQFKSRIRGVQIYSSECIHKNGRSLTPILNLLGPILQRRCREKQVDLRNVLGNFADSLASLFPDQPEGKHGDGTDQPTERIVQDLIGLMRTFARNEPLVLCIENIDLAEPATLHCLTHVCYRASELNIRLILTCRNLDAMSVLNEMAKLLGPNFIRIPLEPISRVESRELVRYLESNRGKQAQILDRASGNPLWLLESARNEKSHALVAAMHALIREGFNRESLKLLHVLAVSRVSASAESFARIVAMDVESVRKELLWLRKIGAVHESIQGFEMRIDGLRAVIQTDFSASAARKIHQALYNNRQEMHGVTEELLAEHAFHGGLWSQAATHFSALANLAAKRGDCKGALSWYAELKFVLQKLKQELPFGEEVTIAMCLAKSGRLRIAEKIYVRLLSESQIQEDLRIQLLLMYRGGEVDSTYLDQRLTFLREITKPSNSVQQHAALLLAKLSGSFLAAGDLLSAADALKRAKSALEITPSQDAELFARGVQGFLSMNQGNFRDASEIYKTLSRETSEFTASALTNRGVCFEHLGSIRTAIGFQKRAHRLVWKAGHLVGQFLCLGNLGAFHTKLGDFKEAHQYFGQMKKLASEIGPAEISFKGVEAEETLLEIMEGRYQAALQHLQTALSSNSLLKRTRLECLILECEIHFLVGADVKAADVERIVHEGAWSPSPLYAVQLALFRSRTKTSVPEAVSILETALATARQASLLYEACKIELEIGTRLQESDLESGKLRAEEALRISKKNGYLPLQARALLVRGLCGRNTKEREHYLQESFKLASEIGTPEIVSASAYHLGVLSQTANQQDGAREYFATSTRLTSEITDQIPARFRPGYLGKSWRREARRLYGELLQGHPIKLPVVEFPASFKDHHYFRTLYRISVAAASAKTVDAFLLELLPAIGLSRDSVVVMLKSGERTAWHALRVTVTEGLRQRVLAVAGKFTDQALFHAQERWIPIRSLQYSGGIYVLIRKRNQMDEDEMEFFTILGTLISSALDQIHNRARTQPAVSAANFHGIVGNSRAIRDLCTQIEVISPNNATVLIQGETGTGKELVARAIHKLSSRERAPFIAIDCGAIPEGLMESELFGSKRGAFTGAVADRPGVFEAAQHGTLFLDEISNMNPGMQAKLLRAIQEREIRRVGETRSRPIDVRLIAASNANLKQLAAEGAFRQDLFFRLNVIDIQIPPLRNRREDIPLLASHFLSRLNAEQNTAKAFGTEAFHLLFTHHFPGNIRELQNAVERAFFIASGRMISSITIENVSGDDSIDEARKWLDDLAEGRRNFWTAIHDRYKRRDISREKVVALIDLGLRTTHGNYRNLASLLHIDQSEYRRLMDFLRRNNCLLDFRPYRKLESLS